MSVLRKKRTYAILLMLVLLLLYYYSDKIWEMLYPIHYKQEIGISAAKYNVDPLLIAAIIRVESNYRPDGMSKKGAVGIMQLMPETAKWIRDSTNMEVSLDQLHQVQVNIHMGAWYVNWLLDHFDGNLNYAIAAYNAGQGNVNKWRTSNVWNGSEDTVSNIPIGETRHYVQRVLYYYKKYQTIYGPDF